METALALCLGAVDAALVLGLLATLSVRLRARRLVGDVLAREGQALAWRIAAWAVLAVASTWVLLHPGELPRIHSFAPLALAALFVALVPGAADRVCGRRGLRRGWTVRALEDLEEWRMTGDHLRFRLGPVWEAVPLAAADQEPLLERLRSAIPERESPFR